MSSAPRHPKDHTLAQQLGRAFVLFEVLVVAAFFVTIFAYGANWAWLSPEVEESRLAVQAEAAAFTAMVNEETGIRGFLLTNDPRFLETYRHGEVERIKANKALASYADTVAASSGPMVRTLLAAETWRERWAKAAAASEPGRTAPAMAEGGRLFNAYRGEQALFAAALEQRRDRLSLQEGRLVMARVGLELLVFLIVLLLVLRQHQALRREIVDPVAALLHHIRGVRDGQLQATIRPTGPRELRQLGEGLNEMVFALVAAHEVAELRAGALREHATRLRQILDASREFSESLNLAYVVESVRTSTLTMGGYEKVIIWLMDDDQKCLVNSEESAASNAAPNKVPTVAARAAKSGRIAFEAASRQVRFDAGDTPICAIAIPLIVGARVVGVLEALHATGQVATKEVVDVLEMVATHAATAIESARLHEVIEERSQVDPLTGLSNRRRLEQDLEIEYKCCQRYERPLSFVMFDVDHFKAFNDAHGHPKADIILQELASIIQGCARETDTAYRYGGEEFCILLRETTAEDAMHFAERLRQRIELRFSVNGVPGVTASFGVADIKPDTLTARALVEAADAAMYESKHAGRNRVALSARPVLVTEALAVVTPLSAPPETAGI